jgi:hypothetical protein
MKVYSLEIQSAMLVFSTQLCELYCPCNLLFGSVTRLKLFYILLRFCWIGLFSNKNILSVLIFFVLKHSIFVALLFRLFHLFPYCRTFAADLKLFGQHILTPAAVLAALQKQNTQTSKQIFPEKEYRGLSPNFHIHVSVSDVYIPTIDLLAYSAGGNMQTDPGTI